MHFNFRQEPQPRNYLPGSGTLERKSINLASGGQESGVGGERERDLMLLDSYQPPPPPKVITEQPKPANAVQHFHPFERTYPKTLESLAERVHPFYGLSATPGSMTLGLVSGVGSHQQQHHQQQQQQQQHQQGHSAPLGRASTLGRGVRGGMTAAGAAAAGNTMSLTRGGRLQRSGSDQRLPMVESGGSEFYEYCMSGLSATAAAATAGKSSLKSSTHGSAANYLGSTSNRPTPSAGGGISGGGGVAGASRVVQQVTRRRTSIDYASDTEASVRCGYGGSRRSPMPGYTVDRSWKTPPVTAAAAAAGLALTPKTPTTPTSSYSMHQQQHQQLQQHQQQQLASSRYYEC